MKRVHLVGRQDMGKTTLMVALVEELRRGGLVVGTIKHSGHDHELDTPGKDSHRHRQAGAGPVTVVTPSDLAIHLKNPGDPGFYDILAPFYSHCDLVLVEGHIAARGVPKLEVWRAAGTQPPLALEWDDVTALITDDTPPPMKAPPPIWPRRDLARLARQILHQT